MYHVSSGGDYAIQDLFVETVKAMKLTLDDDVEVRPRNPDDVFSILLDPSRTQADFDWGTRTTLSDGVRMAIDYYRDRGLTETYTHLKPAEKSHARS